MRTKRLVIVALLWLVSMPATAMVQYTVLLEGVEGEPRDNIMAALTLVQRQGQAVPVRVLRQMHRQASGEIRRALQPYGYYAPDITANLERSENRSHWLASYSVALGEPVPVIAVNVSSDVRDPAVTAVFQDWQLPVGATLDHRQYRESKELLIQRLHELGYRDADYKEHRVSVDTDTYGAIIELQVAAGTRFTFGELRFGESPFDEDYLRGFQIIEPGTPYDERQVVEQRRMLSASGLFREVEVEPLEPSQDSPGVVPLRVAFTPVLPNRYRANVAWGTDTGFGLGAGWLRRYLGTRGHNFSFGLGAVEERNRLAADLNYVIPLNPMDGSRFKLGARHEGKDLNFEDVDLDEGGETRIETNLLTGVWQRAAIPWGDFTVTPEIGLVLLQEDYDVFEVVFGNLPDETQDIIKESIGRESLALLQPQFDVLAPTLSLRARRADDALYIRNGDFFNAQFLIANENLGSNIEFTQLRLDTWHIRSFTENSRFLLRTNMGYSEADTGDVLNVEFNKMPQYYEFRAGGPRSLRGYAFETVFPETSSTGGKNQLIVSLEYEHQVIADWSVAGFVDSGNAFNSWSDYDAKTGGGLGARWRSPVGLVRIDLGVPLDDAEGSFQVNITVGPEF